MKASAIAHSNIAFVKYWGKKDTKLFIPTRSNISMTLDALTSTTTIEFSNDYEKDVLIINGKEQSGKAYDKAIRHIGTIRKYAGVTDKAKVVSENNFPTAAGMASSASGFAAMTVAANEALGLGLDDKQLSIISRQGSGSSCRSIKGGFVEWHTGNTSEESYAEQVFDENHWDLRDIIAIVEPEEKKVSSRAGMQMSMENCPLYPDFVKGAEKNLADVKKGLAEKDFNLTGEALELDSLMLHSIMMTTKPALLYWAAPTVKVMHEIMNWREQGLQAYHTIDAGPNVHIITTAEYANEIEQKAKEIEGVKGIIHSKVGGDAKIISKNLF